LKFSVSSVIQFCQCFYGQLRLKEGAMQGGPLSPLLNNIVLDERDKELEKRGLAEWPG